MLKVVHGGNLDPDAGKARPDQLVLPEDPTFVPGLMLPGLNVDLSALDITTVLETPRKMSSLLSSYLHGSNKSSFQREIQLQLSSSQVGTAAFGLPSQISSAQKGPQVELPAYLEEGGVLLQPDFEFDAEGNIIELPLKGNSDRIVIHETEEYNDVEMTGANQARLTNMDRADEFEDLPMFDVGMDLPLGEPPSNQRHKVDDKPNDIDAVPPGQSEAHMPLKKRRLRNIEADDLPELRNSDLAQWNSDYAHNMACAVKMKKNNKLVTIAKRNAAFCVLGVGIAAVGLGLGASSVPHPLDIFSGTRLLSALTGKKIQGLRRKRDRSSANGSDTDEFERNVRQKTKDGEVGRWAGSENGEIVPFDDIEIGRHAPPSLQDDASLQMPWNVTASVHSSFRGSSIAGGHSGVNSAFRPGSDALISGSFAGRRGRLTSASPLAGRGGMRNALLGLSLQEDEELGMDSFAGVDMESVVGDITREQNIGMSSPAAAREKHAEPHWFLSNLDQQTVNFLEYVKNRIADITNATTDGELHPEISFDCLLLPASSSRIVATQGFLHVLILATNGALRVRQDVDMGTARGCDDAGEIILSMPS
ncbi:predicted protein [Uncinocarpus reesii 1704]|uniref:Rad21/Rec8-like protein N-terminal domain-containing protein n=1 Tax=Uncinocarpus reesii (strain UAMH 1704) TaxID=336963 RepID=C4JU18_UNCRE|nr:uncharacterized protein UREG_05957 [Uncinocarpus reesii 1704]EEP81115.1 predicted protein [Uncinocarpus reesii 1704]